jgi:hypothetical protein
MCEQKLSRERAAPVQTNIVDARREIQSAFEQAMALVDTPEPQTLVEVEKALWTAMLKLGRALLVLFLVRQAARPRPVEYESEGQRYLLKGEIRKSDLGTRFGKVAFIRPIGRRASAPWGAADLLVDRELGLCSGFSLSVVLSIGRLAAQMAFGAVRSNFQEFHEWAPSPRAILRMVDGLGAEARPFLEQAPAPADDGEVLVVLVDAGGAPMINPSEYERRSQARGGALSEVTRRLARRNRRRKQTKKRRAPGKKSKNAKMAVVGALYTLRRTPQGLEGPIHKRVYATFESHEELFVWLHREAKKRGYGKKPTVFLADGSEHIWRLQMQYFPVAEVCIDWYHVIEKLWEAGQATHPAGSYALNGWVSTQKGRLKRGNVQAVLDELDQRLEKIPQTGPGNKGKRERLVKVYNYLVEHRSRLRYKELRERDLDIGTGIIEGAVRNLVRMRLDGPGMRWGRGRSEFILHLRCIYINKQWDDFASYAAKQRIQLPAEPIPTIPHLAKVA